MNEYEMMKAMLKRVRGDDEDCWSYDDSEHTIWIHCDDDWYTRVFNFDANGKLIKFR